MVLNVRHKELYNLIFSTTKRIVNKQNYFLKNAVRTCFTNHQNNLTSFSDIFRCLVFYYVHLNDLPSKCCFTLLRFITVS